ncbi:beta-N-acetylhexosaminidase [Chitinophaga nivalis]|uniref:beta-N-acetylhexosaminidase n=1 Tax=Chitinophaga nivalis TaxID=2991709 RepID=A0ABT3INA6_9BACT|nr:family 20 glycosylhydrolase [Chitinophaga nivalis]MCW3464881.1 family 20 glycosylhydrolase [Chitinophaga nivalis]MCW3485428.1 family 20 glycosylhydrolase [Chitinophaga nivalis]
MKKILLITILTIVHNCLLAQRKGAAPTAAVIPLPVAASYSTDTFYITANVSIIAASGLAPEAALLREYIHAASGLELPVNVAQAPKKIILEIDTLAVTHKEGYLLQAGSQQVKLIARGPIGVVYAMETMRQLWRHTTSGSLAVPGARIADYPRFGYRGMHLDVGRHFFSVEFIKQFIDQLALYKINNFHWHLTDDQGWRIEIKKYPRLQSVAAWRDQTMIGHKKELPHRFDGKRYGGFYTQEEVKSVIAYAAARHINVIPEIEMPGHALAALTAYPTLGCTGGPYKTAQFWGVFDDVFCAGKDSTFFFLQDVLDEVIALFPSSYIHIGGDECPKARWKVCAACQQRMKQLHLPDESALQSYFIRRISDYVNSKGRSIIGWDEILEGGLAPGATVMSWRGVEGAVSAARQQQQVIMTPEDELYFDHYQSLYPAEKVAAGGFTPLDEVYAYEPLHVAADTALLPFIAGIQGEIWSEYLPTAEHARYMIFPRLQAMAERAWSPQHVRDFNDFTSRLEAQQPLLQQVGIAHKPVYQEINYTLDSVGKRKLYISLHTYATNAQIRYTTDGSTPGLKSPLYKGRIVLSGNTDFQAQLFEAGKPVGRVFRQPFLVHKATGAAITLQQQPGAKYGGGAGKLVNGVAGTHRFNDQQWLGFSVNDLDAVIDLGAVETIRQAGANILNYHWQKMWAPVSLQFEASEDGVHYQQLGAANAFPVNGINEVRLAVPAMKARYIKVKAINKGVIPAGEYGAGGNSLLMVDELLVN